MRVSRSLIKPHVSANSKWYRACCHNKVYKWSPNYLVKSLRRLSMGNKLPEELDEKKFKTLEEETTDEMEVAT
jgi:hypothetical protein